MDGAQDPQAAEQQQLLYQQAQQNQQEYMVQVQQIQYQMQQAQAGAEAEEMEQELENFLDEQGSDSDAPQPTQPKADATVKYSKVERLFGPKDGSAPAVVFLDDEGM